jgi:hypothetical protein
MRETTRLPVFLRAWRGGSKVCALVLVALLGLAGNAFGKIGESYAQVLAEARQDRDALAITPWDYDGQPSLRVEYRNKDVIHHVFNAQGTESEFYWYANHEVTWKEVAVIQRIFKTKWHREQITPEWTTWVSQDNLLLAVAGKELHILTPDAVAKASVKEEAGLHRAQTAQEESTIDEFLNSPPGSPLPTPPAAPSVASKPAPTGDQNDCLPFAVESLARRDRRVYVDRRRQKAGRSCRGILSAHREKQCLDV